MNDLISSLEITSEEETLAAKSSAKSGSRFEANIKKFKPPQGKWWWTLRLPNIKKEYYIAAGGILICDKQFLINRHGGKELKEGIWVLIEKTKKGIEYTDMGGKYSLDDGDIYATMAREFREELYNTAEIPYRQVKYLCTNNLSLEGVLGSNRRRTTSPRLTQSAENRREVTGKGQKFNGIYVSRKGLYFSLIVNRSFLPSLSLIPEEVERAREEIINSNEFCNTETYRTLSLKFLPFEDIPKSRHLLSYRLKTILLLGPLKSKIDLDFNGPFKI